MDILVNAITIGLKSILRVVDMMDKFMGSMMSGMKPEEKEKMMSEMMEKFMEGMSPEEKRGLMEKIMPKMMSGMTGGGMPMMGMMKGMQEAMEKGFKPWETCARMEGYLKDIAQTNREILEELKKK